MKVANLENDIITLRHQKIDYEKEIMQQEKQYELLKERLQSIFYKKQSGGDLFVGLH